MGHSIQTVGTRTEIFNDCDLLLLLRLFGEVIRKKPELDPAIAAMRDYWDDCCQGYGPGLIHLRLADLAATGSAKEALLRFFDDVEAELRSFGTTIPAKTIRERFRVRGVVFNDQDVSRILSALVRLRRLVEP